MQTILLELIDRYHVKRIDSKEFSVIASYFQDLEDIAKKYNVELLEKANSASKLTVWGRFRIDD